MFDSVLIYCSCLSLLPPEALLSINPLKRFGFRILSLHIVLGEISAKRSEVLCVEFFRGTGKLPGPVLLDVNRTTNRFLVFKEIRVPEGVVEGARVVVCCAKFNL